MLDVVLAALDGEGLAGLRALDVDGREDERAVVAVDVQRAVPRRRLAFGCGLTRKGSGRKVS